LGDCNALNPSDVDGARVEIATGSENTQVRLRQFYRRAIPTRHGAVQADISVEMPQGCPGKGRWLEIVQH
jgi:hypothetical protein